MLNAGDRIATWVVVRPLGAGGMGSVYLCHSAMSERIRAAVKVLAASRVDDDMGRFVREVEALDALRHPAIVRIKGFGEDPGLGALWLAMELVDGEDLEHRRQRGPMAPDAAVRVFSEVADGLAHAHARGVYHRDLKPANLLITPEGAGHVVDFGIAVQSDRTRLTQAGLVVGTPAYMAPELFEGDALELARLDVYALGLVLHEALTGALAYPHDPSLSTGQSMMRLLARKAKATAFDPGPGCPDALREVVRRATAPDPADRFGSMAELAAALRAPPARPDAPAPPPVARPEPDVEPTPPEPPPAVDEAPPTRWVQGPRSGPPEAANRRRLAAGAVGVAIAGAGVAVVALGAAAGWWYTVGRLIDARIAVPAGVSPVRLWVGDAELVGRADGDATAFDFRGVPGPRTVSLIAGPQCAAATDGAWAPGEVCPACCQCASTPVDLLGDVALAALAPAYDRERTATLEVPTHPTWPTWVLQDGAPTKTMAVRRTAAPGPMAVDVVRGACGVDDLGCADRYAPDATEPGTCPPGCWSGKVSVDLPCGAGDWTARLPVPAPVGGEAAPYLGEWKGRTPTYRVDLSIRLSGDDMAITLRTQNLVDGFWGDRWRSHGREPHFTDGMLVFDANADDEYLVPWAVYVQVEPPDGTGPRLRLHETDRTDEIVLTR